MPFVITATGLDKPARAFFVPSSGFGTVGPSFFEFDDTKRNGTFRWKSAPLRAPDGRQVEIREVQLYVRSYDANSTIQVQVGPTSKMHTIPAAGREQITFHFSERNEVLDVRVISTAGDPAVNEAPTIEAVRIGWQPRHLLR